MFDCVSDIFGGANEGTLGKQAIAQMKQKIRGLAIIIATMNRSATRAEIVAVEEVVQNHDQLTESKVDAIVKMLRAGREKEVERAYSSKVKSGKSEALVA
jgi:hypothetical protein